MLGTDSFFVYGDNGIFRLNIISLISANCVLLIEEEGRVLVFPPMRYNLLLYTSAAACLRGLILDDNW